MARHYSVKDFFRQTPNALLARYFAARGLFAGLDFGAMKAGKPDELFDGWMALPDEDRRRRDADFRDIDDMSNEKAWLAMLGEARWHLRNQQPQVQGFIEAMATLPNHHARAMTVYLDHADYWLGVRQGGKRLQPQHDLPAHRAGPLDPPREPGPALRGVAWPAVEMAALNAARIAGKGESDIRALVTKLQAARALAQQA